MGGHCHWLKWNACWSFFLVMLLNIANLPDLCHAKLDHEQRIPREAWVNWRCLPCKGELDVYSQDGR